MNNSFSLQQMSRTGNLDFNLISRQYKLNLMADFMRMKYENLKVKQSEMANHLGYSTSTLQRYRNDINMFHHTELTQKTPINEQKRLQILILTTIPILTRTLKDPKRPQMTSKRPQTKQLKTKSKLKGGDPNDDNATQGSILIEQAFSSN